MITTKAQANRHLERFIEQELDDFLTGSLRSCDLPMDEKRLEQDFVAFLQGCHEDEENDEGNNEATAQGTAVARTWDIQETS